MATTRQDKALVTLRRALEERGVNTKSSAGKYEYFYAYLATDGNGTPVDDLFVIIRDHIYFSWSPDSRFPMDDIEGAADEAARLLHGRRIGKGSCDGRHGHD